MKKLYLFILIVFSFIVTIPAQVVTHAKVTAYMAVKSQCNSNPLLTADMTKINPYKVKIGTQRIAAISRDLEYLFPMGSIIHIDGLGNYTIHDRTNKRLKHTVDILVPNKNSTYKKIAENISHTTKITLVQKPTKKKKNH